MFKLIISSVVSVLIIAGALLVPSLGASEGGTISIENDSENTQTCVVDGVVSDCKQVVNLEQSRADSEQTTTVKASGNGDELLEAE